MTQSHIINMKPKSLYLNLLFALLSFLCVTMTSQRVYACGCIGNSAIEAQYKGSEHILEGELISISLRRVPEPIDLKDSFSVHVYSFRVDTVYKSNTINAKDTIEIVTGVGGGDCGFLMELGKRYMLYDSRMPHFLKGKVPSKLTQMYTNLCARSKETTESEIVELREFIKSYVKWWKFWLW